MRKLGFVQFLQVSIIGCFSTISSACTLTPRTCLEPPNLFYCATDGESCQNGYQDIGHDQRCAHTGRNCGNPASKLKYFDIKQCVTINNTTEIGRKFGMPRAPVTADFAGTEAHKGSRQYLSSCIGPIKDKPRPTQTWCYVWDDYGDRYCGWNDGKFRGGDHKACNYYFIPRTAWARENTETHAWEVCIGFENEGTGGHGWRHFKIFAK